MIPGGPHLGSQTAKAKRNIKMANGLVDAVLAHQKNNGVSQKSRWPTPVQNISAHTTKVPSIWNKKLMSVKYGLAM